MPNTSLSPNDAEQNKDTHFLVQMKRVFASLSEQPKTMLMVEVETGIMRSNICWYVREWRKSNNVAIVKLGDCPISKHGGVQYLTTNPKLFPNQSNQLNLFSDDK
jgi:hypothetical protein